MKKANLVLMAALAAAGVTSLATGLLTPATASPAATQKQAAPQKIGAKMLKPLKAAQEAINAKNWDAAIASLTGGPGHRAEDALRGVHGRRTRLVRPLQKKDYAGAAEALERAVARASLPRPTCPSATRR